MIRWSTDQNALRDGLAPWLEVLSAEHLERDEAGTFSADKWKIIQQTGILGLPFDERWGGLGQDLLTTMHVLEALGAGCRDAGLAFSVSTHLASTGAALHRFGSDRLKAEHLPSICAGTAIGAHAITEPDSGSDALAMSTRADRDGDHFVLNGSKAFVSNGPVADLVVVYARTAPGGGPLGVTAFLVDPRTPGFSCGPPVRTMGLRTSPMCSISLQDCRVPAGQVIGPVNGGFLVLDHVMKWEILCSFVITAGQMRHRLDRCLEYARTRVQFGRPIGSFQAVSHRLVDLELTLAGARKWLYDTAEKLIAGEDVVVDLAMAKLVTSEGNTASALAAVQIFGGSGYLTESGLEKDLRDAVAGTIYSGTSEIQRNRIASSLGLPT